MEDNIYTEAFNSMSLFYLVESDNMSNDMRNQNTFAKNLNALKQFFHFHATSDHKNTRFRETDEFIQQYIVDIIVEFNCHTHIGM